MPSMGKGQSMYLGSWKSSWAQLIGDYSIPCIRHEPLGYMDLVSGDWPIGYLLWTEHPIKKQLLLVS